MSEPKVSLGREDTARYLGLLSKRLGERGLQARLFVVGGAAMALAYYPEGVERRLSDDVDAFGHPSDVVFEIAAEIAEDEGLQQDWLNADAKGFLPAHGTGEGVIVDLSVEGGLTVEVASPELMLAMKIRSARPGRDTDDLAVLVRLVGVRSVDEARDLFDDVYDGEEIFTRRAQTLLEAVLDEYEMESSSPPHTLPAVTSPAAQLRDSGGTSSFQPRTPDGRFSEKYRAEVDPGFGLE